MRLLTVLFGTVLTASVVNGQPAPDPDDRAYFWASRIVLPARTESRTFDLLSASAGNITYMEGIKDVAFEDSSMSFTLASQSAKLGWGNYLGRQALDEIITLLPETNQVTLIVEQAGGAPSQWRMHYWGDGKRIEMRRPPHYGEAKLTPGDEVELTFNPGAVIPTPDGLEVTIEGEPGTRITLDQIEVSQKVREGYVRTEFDLPEGRIWRATAEVAGQPRYRWYRTEEVLNDLYINGRNVERTGAVHIEHTRPIDIRSYLRPGQTNAIGLYGFRIGASPVLYIQATIIMESGEIIRVGTGEDWRYNRDQQHGWSSAGHDTSNWQGVEIAGIPNVHIRADDGTLLLPSYDGLIHFRNPDAARLAYSGEQDVTFEVVIPAGLRERNPQVQWYFAGTDAEGQPRPIEEGVADQPTLCDGSLVFQFNVGRQPRGIYTVAANLIASDSEVFERRPREPVLVVERLRQEPIRDNDWYGSLDLELETEIDFTDLETDRPWIAARPGATRDDPAIEVTDPTIITVNNKAYRETDPLRGAFFSYRIDRFDHPGDFYLIEMTYPDDVRRHIEVMISTKKDDIWTNAQSGVGAETGGNFYLTGEEQTLRWIHVADPGVHSVDVVNVEDGTRAAAGRLRIYHVKGDLPSAQPGQNRHYGIFSERTASRSGVATGFGAEREQEDLPTASIIARTLRDLRWYLDTAERYTQYLKFTGQNAHIMGVYQYYEYNTPYARPYEIETSRLTFSLESVMAETFDVNGVSFYAGVEWSQFSDLATVVNNTQVARGEDTIWMVDADGRQYYGNSLFTIVPNWIHPANQERFEDFMADIAGKYAHLDHFKGLHFYTSAAQRWEYYPPGFTNRANYDDPFLLSYDDITFSRFQQEAGIDLGIDARDPERFTHRAEAVQRPDVRQAYVDWRARKFHELLTKGLRGVRRHGEDLILIGMVPLEEPELLRMWSESGRALSDLLKDYGYDLDLINRTDNLKLGYNVISWRETFPVFASQDPYRWIPKTEPEVYEAFSSGEPRYVMVRNSWDENIATTGGEVIEGFSWRGRLIRDGWIFNALKVRTHPQPSGFHAREAFAQVLIASDPNLLMGAFIDLVLNVGFEQELGSMLDVFTHLPNERFAPVGETGLGTNLAIRRLVKDGRTWFYLVNPGYWRIDAELELANATGAQTVGATPTAIELQSAAGDAVMLPLRLEPYGLVAFSVDGEQAEVRGFRTGSITDRELAHMTRMLDRVEELLENDRVSQALGDSERQFMHDAIAVARNALDAREYARAWSTMTHYQFWSLWQNVLEKASQGMALLPERYDTEPSPDAGEPRSLIARRIAEPIKLDGHLEEPVWSEGVYSTGFVTAEGEPGMAEMGVKAAYDGEHLYFSFVAADLDPSQVKATAASTREFWAAKDDVVVIFLQPQEGKPLYFQLGFNANGILFHQQVIGGAKDYGVIEGWNAEVTTGSDVWTAEVKLPRSVFGLTADPKAPIKVNFHRVVRDDLVDPASWSRSARWHETEDFGTLILE